MGSRMPRTRITRLALIHDAWTDVIAHPSRAALSALGTVLGVAVLLAAVGTAESASAHIVGLVDELSARQVQVLNTPGASTGTDRSPSKLFHFDAPERALRIDGAEHAATLSRLNSVAISSGTLEATPAPADAQVFSSSGEFASVSGAALDGADLKGRGDLPVALIGRALARSLRLPDLERAPTVTLDGLIVRVIGVIEDVEVRPDLLNAVVIPDELARVHFGLTAPETVLVNVRLNSAPVVAPQLPLALQPSGQGSFEIVRPPAPEVLRAGITEQTRGLLLALGLLCLALGAVGIANTTLVSVLERRPEIGLRRSLGGRRSDIVLHFLTESAIVGAVGAVVGAALGALAIVIVAQTQGWQPRIQPAWLLASPLIGITVGILAGLYPAIRSGTIEPIEALRAGTG